MSLDFTIPEIIYLFAAFHGIFLASLIIIKKSFRENVFLFLLILLFSFYLIENVIYSSGYIVQVPHLYFTTLPLIYLIGPLFFLYVRSSLKRSSLKWIDLLHLLPFLFEFTILVPFYALDAQTKIQVYEMTQQSSDNSGQISIYLIGYFVYLASTFFYFYKSFVLIRSSMQNGMKAKEKKKYKALRVVSIGFFLYVFVSLLFSTRAWIDMDISTIAFHINLINLTLLIHTIGYIAFSNPELLEPFDRRSDYKFSSLSPEKKKELSELLAETMETKKLYLNADISASDISHELHITNHELSQLLNVELSTSFYDYINHLRIEHAKSILISKEYRDAKILHIALDSGFSNKSSFLRNFKKSTALTPTAYKKLHENQVPIN